ncbi:nicotinate-nucleotide--dimethylbenzimidazole phosphoribosyltransferase [Thalassospiraceae bacterium LMO-SO8]|nr:nicotinate-nucleotide--dimethylbenzimidazole phosphoribosyltransferase [Alphaproteobacteria bacterium LMO-S08]WND77452.1 nicotinate-nucleotide--dimethylbenzimidazole phosphoribosyltransferase [Thalassospiraceae bacterium LMO-SO8]
MPQIDPPRDPADLLTDLPGPDVDAQTAVRAREAVLTKPAGSLGRLEEITEWLAGWQGRATPRADTIQALVFAGNHGVAAQGISAYPPEVTAQMVANFQAGGAAVNQLCRTFGVDLAVIPLDLDNPTADIAQGPAMTADEFAAAFQAGADAVNAGADLLCVGEMGIANTTAAAAICLGLFGGTGADWAGPGTGLPAAGVSAKADVIARAVAVNGIAPQDGLGVLRALGGRELAAMAGAVARARRLGIPVLLDGFVCGAAAACLDAARPGALDHCRAAHLSAEPGHGRLLAKLGMAPLLQLNMRLGEASGAVLAVALVRAALACHRGMATFESAGVSGKD